MNLAVGIFIMVLTALMAICETPATPMKSLCVLDGAGHCWIDQAGGVERVPQPGDYVLSPEDMNRIIEKLKSVQ